MVAYSALGNTGRPNEETASSDPVLLEDPVIKKVAERKGVTVAQVIFCFCF